MVNVEKFKIGNTDYPVRDANTLRSLTTAQATTLEANGTYNGEEVEDGEVFTSVDGAFKEFKKEQIPYLTSNYAIDNVVEFCPIVVTSSTIVRATDTYGYLEYSEDNGETWSRSQAGGSDFRVKYYPASFKCLCNGVNDDVYILIHYDNLYHDEIFKSTDGGKNFTYLSTINNSNSIGFMGFLKTTNTLVVLPINYGVPINESYYSTDGGATWSRFNMYSNYSIPYRIGCLDEDTFIILGNDGNVYTTTNWTTWTQISTQSLSSMGDQYDFDDGYKTRIRRCGSYLLFFAHYNGMKVAYSADNGVTWNVRNALPSGMWLIAYSNGYYYTFKSGTYYVADDLLSDSWEEKEFMSFDSGTSYHYMPAVAAGTMVVLGTTSGTGLVPTVPYYTYSLNVISGVPLNSIADAGTGIRFDTETIQNFTLVGSPIVSDGIASGLDTSNYLSATTSLDTSKAWKVRTHFKLTSHDGSMGEQILAGKYPQSLNIAIVTSTSKLSIDISYSGSQADITLTGSTISTGQDYYIEVGWDGTKYYLKESTTDFDSLVETASQNSTTPMNSFTTFYLGTYEYESGRYWGTFNGNLYLHDTEIANDGNVLWAPYTISDKPAITLDIATDQANAPTSSDEGYVGKLWITSGGAVYICTGVSGSTYTWAQITVS